VCEDDCALYAITKDKVLELYYQKSDERPHQ
jgi:hypothetical protein